MAKFSKGGFVLMAKCLRAAMEDYEHLETGTQAILCAASYIAKSFEEDNTAFDAVHFMAVVKGDRPINSKPIPSIAKKAAEAATNCGACGELWSLHIRGRCPDIRARG